MTANNEEETIDKAASKPEESETTDDDPLPPEYYEELRRKSYARHVALGIDDLPEGARDFCETQAEAKIACENIGDEEARKTVYAEMKRATWECIEKTRRNAQNQSL